MTEMHPRLSSRVAEHLAGEHLLFIDNVFVPARTGTTFDVFDPGTGSVIARCAEGDADDIDLAVTAARRAFTIGDWPRMVPADRARFMLRFADLLDSNGEFLAELETIDNGKPLAMARAGIRGWGDMVRYMAGWVTKLGGETMSSSLPGEWHMYTTREPVGVVGQIIPWNFPISMAIWKLAPALATGCTVVLKPAEQTPLTALVIGALLRDAGMPAGVVNIVNGIGTVAGHALASHAGVDKVAFTGSTATGKRIVQAALGNLKRVSLELGGKSPVFVFPDADLERAIPGASAAIFNNSGQVCAAGSRLYVHRTIFDKVVGAVSDHADALTVGHGLDAGTQIGPLVSQLQQQRVRDIVDSGLQSGARARTTRGDRINAAGYFYPPTVLVDTTQQMNVARDEIFGPVVCAMPFDDDDLDRIAAIGNDTDMGLFAGIWTRDLSVAHKLARRLRVGSVSVNAHTANEPALPFGGYKQSGWGRERGREVLELYTEVKSVAVQL